MRMVVAAKGTQKLAVCTCISICLLKEREESGRGWDYLYQQMEGTHCPCILLLFWKHCYTRSCGIWASGIFRKNKVIRELLKNSKHKTVNISTAERIVTDSFRLHGCDWSQQTAWYIHCIVTDPSSLQQHYSRYKFIFKNQNAFCTPAMSSRVLLLTTIFLVIFSCN
jgi:hypothetical protein